MKQDTAKQSASMRARIRRLRRQYRRRMIIIGVLFFIIGVVAGIFAYRWYTGHNPDVAEGAATQALTEVTPQPEQSEGETQTEQPEQEAQAEQFAPEDEAQGGFFVDGTTEQDSEDIAWVFPEVEEQTEAPAEVSAEPTPVPDLTSEMVPEYDPAEAEVPVEYMTLPDENGETEIESAIAPATEEAPAEAETPATEEAPEAPAEAQTPATEEAPAEAGTPAAEEAPAEAETPATEGAPAEAGTPAAEEAPAEAETPAAEEAPAEAETPAVEEVPAEAETPVVEETPAQAEAPVVEETPAQAEAPATEETPTAEAAPAAEEASAEAEAVEEPAEQPEEIPVGPQVIAIVPYGESFTYNTQIKADGTARVEATDEPFETISLTQTMKGYMRPSDFATKYSTQYKLQGNEAGAGFELILNDYTGTATVIPQNVIDISLRSESGDSVERGYQLMDAEIAGNYSVALTTNTPKMLYKRYQYSSAGEEMFYLVVTTYNDGAAQMILFELESDEPEPEPAIIYNTLQRGIISDEVANMQARLIELGYLKGVADGQFGPMTEEAIKAAQTAFGLEANGVADNAFQQKLFEGAEPTPAPQEEASEGEANGENTVG